LGDSFGTFSFGQTQLGGLFLDFNFFNFMGATSKGLLLDFFLGNCGLGTYEGRIWKFFGHTLKLLGTFLGSIWSKAHFKGTLQGSLGLSLKHPCHKVILKDPLNPKHLGMLK
jgi:hypothetical protein